MNEQLANISVLEGIQAQANESMGHGQSACGMAVFNGVYTDKIKNLVRNVDSVHDQHMDEIQFEQEAAANLAVATKGRQNLDKVEFQVRKQLQDEVNSTSATLTGKISDPAFKKEIAEFNALVGTLQSKYGQYGTTKYTFNPVK